MIQVLIERRLIEGTDMIVHDTFRRIRNEAIKIPGYISAEIYRDEDDPNHYVVISSWRSREDWDAWARSEERRQANGAFQSLLRESEEITVLEPV